MIRLLLQRVRWARCLVNGEAVGEIGAGLLVLVGVGEGASSDDAAKLARKVARLRIFSDEDGKMNKSLQDAEAPAVLSVSQFTLWADASSGNRPSYSRAARPELAKPLYEQFNDGLRREGVAVQTGIFGADMQIELCNDGPVTIWLEA